MSRDLAEAYLLRRLADDPDAELSDDLFDLGAIAEWMQEDPQGVRARSLKLDEIFFGQIGTYRIAYEKDPASLDRLLVPRPWDERFPATYVVTHLQRTLVIEARSHQLKKGDALDFCHTAFAAAYGSLIALDKHWKRRVEALAARDRLARTYYKEELEHLVDDLEALCRPAS